MCDVMKEDGTMEWCAGEITVAVSEVLEVYGAWQVGAPVLDRMKEKLKRLKRGVEELEFYLGGLCEEGRHDETEGKGGGGSCVERVGQGGEACS